MQQKVKKPVQPQAVVKPILTGAWNGPDMWQMVPKRMLSILLIAALYVFCSIMLVFDNTVLRILTSVVIIVVAAYNQYVRGLEFGEKAAAFSEIQYARQEEGHPIDPQDRRRCFHPWKGLAATLIAAIPFVLICVVYAFMARTDAYTLGVLPAWTSNLMNQNEFCDALNYYNITRTVDLRTVLRIIVRCMTMPVVSIANIFGDQAVLWADRLSALFVLLVPALFGLGYSRGHVMRTKINTGIQQGVDKKKRKERKERKRRQQSSAPERLI